MSEPATTHKQPPASWWQLTIEVGGAFFVAYMFIVMIMTASAQQVVVAALGKVTPAVSYSTAWADLKMVERVNKELVADTKWLPLAQNLQVKTANDVEEASGDFERDWTPFAGVATRADILTACDIKPLTAAGQEDRYKLWMAMTGCPAEGTLSAQQQKDLMAALQSIGNFAVDYGKWKAANDAFIASNDLVAKTIEKIDLATTQLRDWNALRADFSDTNLLVQNWSYGHGLFVDVPPSIIQILLSFWSGAFGALLITLVLVVYPQSVLSAGQTTAHAARLFLGGLIALCAYIVLSGGSTILGSAASFNAAQANYMTYAAVGILAGMFSDRVALWLSKSANKFFGDPASSQLQPQPAAVLTVVPVAPQANPAGGGG